MKKLSGAVILLAALLMPAGVYAASTALPIPNDLQLRADAGESEAQYQLGILHHGSKNYREAERWLQRAASQGMAKSQLALGLMILEGQGIAQDRLTAAEWIGKAAEQNLPMAQYSLGWLHREGHGVIKDDGLAALWWRKAAAQGLSLAQYELAGLYQQGSGVEEDEKQAIALYRQAASAGLARAALALALLYEKEDITQALYWFRQAATGGDVRAQQALGRLYLLDKRLPRQEKEAAHWYLQAAKQGDGEASLVLGLLHAQGRGVGQDKSQAVLWLGKAVAAEAAGAALLSALLQAEPEQQAVWLQQVLKDGEDKDADALAALSWIYRLGIVVAADEAAAEAWHNRWQGKFFEHLLGTSGSKCSAVIRYKTRVLVGSVCR